MAISSIKLNTNYIKKSIIKFSKSTLKFLIKNYNFYTLIKTNSIVLKAINTIFCIQQFKKLDFILVIPGPDMKLYPDV